MIEKISRHPSIPLLFFPAVLVFLLISCASQQNLRQGSDPLLGQWRTNQNIILTVHRLEGNELVAEITSAPGFYTTDLGAGTILVRNIQPQAQGKYSGLFTMPGDEKSVKIRLRFMNRNTIVAETGDARAQGNKMVWRRMAATAAPKR